MKKASLRDILVIMHGPLETYCLVPFSDDSVVFQLGGPSSSYEMVQTTRSTATFGQYFTLHTEHVFCEQEKSCTTETSQCLDGYFIHVIV